MIDTATIAATEREIYRVIITRRDASELLVVPTGTWLLPRVALVPKQRVADQLIRECRARWAIDSYCLFVPEISASEKPPCAVTESLRQNGDAPTGTRWVHRDLACGCLKEEKTTVAAALAEVDSYRTRQKPGPFGRPGWLKELFEWVETQIAPLDLRPTGRFEQCNASPTFSLIRIETDGKAVWFKATGGPNHHELSIACVLSRLFPGHVPTVIAVRESWNAWLSMEVTGASLDSLHETSEWKKVAAELAEFQIASITKLPELTVSGCKDFTSSQLMSEVAPFLDRVSMLMAMQKKRPPPSLTKCEIDFLGEQLRKAVALLGESGLPDTIGHLDFNPGNIFVGPKGCVFLDWSEGCIANPVITLEYLREHFLRNHAHGPGTEEIDEAYERVWSGFVSREKVLRAMEASRLVAVFAYSLAISTSALANDSVPRQDGFLRSLARRMFREAHGWGRSSRA